MMVGATVASALAVPLAVVLGGWSFSLAVWAVPAVLAVAVWEPIAHRAGRARAEAPAQLPWRNRFARLVACYQAGTSLMFYGWLTWLAPYYEAGGLESGEGRAVARGVERRADPGRAARPAMAERHRRWPFWAGLTHVGSPAPSVRCSCPNRPSSGPGCGPRLMGIGVGAGFPLGLSVIAWRTPHGAASAATSGLALGVGYTVAGLGPLLMGVLIDITGGYARRSACCSPPGRCRRAIWRIGDRPR